MSRSVNGTLIETRDVHAACICMYVDIYLDAFVSHGCDTATLNENNATLLSCLYPCVSLSMCVLIMPVYTYVHIQRTQQQQQLRVYEARS